MQLDKIAFLIGYINGKLDDLSDDIISDSILYDYICRILVNIMENGSCALSALKERIEQITADYVEPVAGARERLDNALEVIIVTYYAALIKQHATTVLDRIEGINE